jgi:carnosine N-methyltransferase
MVPCRAPMEDFSRLDQEQQEAALEYLHYLKVLKHFQNYKSHCDTRILAKYQRDFQALSEEDKAIIPWYPGKLDQIKELVGRNQEVLFQMIQSHVDDIEEDEQEVDVPQNRMKEFVSAEQAQENIRSLLRQLVRDWSEEGVKERIMSYGPIVNALEDYFPGTEERNKAKVLVPGAGLGRLVHDLSNLGFDCQGNEFSLFMLLPSEWILNSGPKPGEKTIYPWILPFSNHLSVEDQTRPVLIPDITPTAPTTGGSMSMTAGDFLSVYTEPESWNVIVTCFFLDTAKNVVEYIRRINQLLVPGGTWINHGPLLYHFEGSAEQSIELSMEEICRVIQGFGLEIMQEARYDCPYTQDSLSMHQTVYQTHFMVIHKKGL